MEEWLEHEWHKIRLVLQAPDMPPLDQMLYRLVAAFGLGCLAVAVHSFTSGRGGPKTDRTLMTTLIMLSTLIALLTGVVRDNTARAFTLVGALAIIRFRTVVEDTRDTAFVIYSVVAGMAAGAGYVAGALACTPLVLLAAWLFRPRGVTTPAVEGVLALRLGAGQSPQEAVQAVLAQHLKAFRLTGLSTARGGAALDVTYAIRLPPPERVFALVSELSRIDGVQGVEVKED
jgi:hypothetical protein